ncbi:hypothetical protein Tco_0393709 [Tanacetum coccineum]
MASLCEITLMRRKKKALRDPPGSTLDTLRSFSKPAPISSQEVGGAADIDGSGVGDCWPLQHMNKANIRKKMTKEERKAIIKVGTKDNVKYQSKDVVKQKKDLRPLFTKLPHKSLNLLLISNEIRTTRAGGHGKNNFLEVLVLLKLKVIY